MFLSSARSTFLLLALGVVVLLFLVIFIDLGDDVEFIYLSIYLFTIFDTAEVETPVFLAISAMGIPYSEKSLIAI